MNRRLNINFFTVIILKEVCLKEICHIILTLFQTELAQGAKISLSYNNSRYKVII